MPILQNKNTIITIITNKQTITAPILPILTAFKGLPQNLHG